jgi:hypothetical protein
MSASVDAPAQEYRRMKKIFATNWISAARAMAPASHSASAAFHPARPGIGAVAPRLALAGADAERD